MIDRRVMSWGLFFGLVVNVALSYFTFGATGAGVFFAFFGSLAAIINLFFGRQGETQNAVQRIVRTTIRNSQSLFIVAILVWLGVLTQGGFLSAKAILSDENRNYVFSGLVLDSSQRTQSNFAITVAKNSNEQDIITTDVSGQFYLKISKADDLADYILKWHDELGEQSLELSYDTSSILKIELRSKPEVQPVRTTFLTLDGFAPGFLAAGRLDILDHPIIKKDAFVIINDTYLINQQFHALYGREYGYPEGFFDIFNQSNHRQQDEPNGTLSSMFENKERILFYPIGNSIGINNLEQFDDKFLKKELRDTDYFPSGFNIDPNLYYCNGEDWENWNIPDEIGEINRHMPTLYRKFEKSDLSLLEGSHQEALLRAVSEADVVTVESYLLLLETYYSESFREVHQRFETKITEAFGVNATEKYHSLEYEYDFEKSWKEIKSQIFTNKFFAETAVVFDKPKNSLEFLLGGSDDFPDNFTFIVGSPAAHYGFEFLIPLPNINVRLAIIENISEHSISIDQILISTIAESQLRKKSADNMRFPEQQEFDSGYFPQKILTPKEQLVIPLYFEINADPSNFDGRFSSSRQLTNEAYNKNQIEFDEFCSTEDFANSFRNLREQLPAETIINFYHDWSDLTKVDDGDELLAKKTLKNIDDSTIKEIEFHSFLFGSNIKLTSYVIDSKKMPVRPDLNVASIVIAGTESGSCPHVLTMQDGDRWISQGVLFPTASSKANSTSNYVHELKDIPSRIIIAEFEREKTYIDLLKLRVIRKNGVVEELDVGKPTLTDFDENYLVLKQNEFFELPRKLIEEKDSIEKLELLVGGYYETDAKAFFSRARAVDE